MANDVAIKIEHVSKNFVLPHEKVTSIKGAFTSVYRKKDKSSEVQHALRDINFEIKKGEFFGIVGRNGSGKSTLLKILAGIYQPNEGNVHVHGKLVPFIELGVGFNPELTGRENVYLNGAMLGFSRKEVDDMYDNIVSFAELERFMDQKLKNYSSGMQVRLAFSMATRAEADILLVDEVLAVGDADFQRKCFDYFKALKKNKQTVVFVSHDMAAVREYCDRAILIEDSKILLAGDTERIATAYARMFTGESVQKKPIGKESRWGNKRIEYTNIQLSGKVISDDDRDFTLEFIAKAHSRLVDPIFGFTIRDAAGHPIIGTNTKILKQHVGVIEAGRSITVKWTMPNIFSDGNHSVDPAIVEEDGVTICDWWEDARTFEVKKEERTPYPVTPPIQFSSH